MNFAFNARLKLLLLSLLLLIGIGAIAWGQVEAKAPVDRAISQSCIPTWESALTVTDAFSTTATLTFGQFVTATTGLDAECGEVPIPPPPPPGVFDARFVLSDGNAATRDIHRHVGGWNLRLQPATDGEPVTISWDPATLPQDGFFLRDLFGGLFLNVDMNAQSSVVLPQPLEPTLSNLQIVWESACGAPTFWEGSVDNDWFNSANWVDGVVPDGSTATAVISTGGDVRVPGAATVGCLLVDADSVIGWLATNMTIETETINNGLIRVGLDLPLP